MGLRMNRWGCIALLVALLSTANASANRFSEFTVHSVVVVRDSLAGLVWQKTIATTKTWEQALAHCEGSPAAGRGDWRLPNKKELSTLVDFSASNPASSFPEMSNATFWSSTPYKGDLAKAWYVRFSDGRIYREAKTTEYSVLCVRTPLRDNGNGTIRDSARGITWTKCAVGQTFDPPSNTCTGNATGVKYCETDDNTCNDGVAGGLVSSGPLFDACDTSNSAGHTDWRVPTIQELRGLILCSNGHVVDGDYPAQCSDGSGDFTTPALDTSLFPNASSWYWSSASYVGSSGFAWNVTFNNGTTGNGSKSSTGSVLCVR